jgi:O-methyltransferase involved in polyketide biosynthesis
MPPTSTHTDFAPVSYTAEKILQKRAFYTSIPRAKEMAEALGVHWRVSPVRALLRRLVWGDVRAGRYIQFRYEALSQALAAHDGQGVVEIAAGYSTRGLDECGRREIYVESDLEDLIAQKPGLVRRIVGEPAANHHFRAVDVCNRDDMHGLAEWIDSQRLARPLAIVHEGLLPYLDDAEKARARDHIADLLRRCSPQGVWVTTDFSERDEVDSLFQRLLTRRLVQQTQRRFHRFADDAGVHAFLAGGGLVGEKLPNLRAGDADAGVRASAENLRAWRIRLRG